MATIITEENVAEVTGSGLVLVDFWAEWCGPCQAMMPVFEAFGADMWDKVTLAKVNIDEVTSIAAQYRVMSIPTFILFKDGQVVEQEVGSQTKEKLEEMVNKHM
jgi:thioredoxin 1